jgi:uncharacterized protein YhaN
MNHVCPSCRKPLVSGISPLCNFCGVKIPSELLFTAEERKKIEADERRAKEMRESLEAERIKKKKEADAFAAGMGSSF